MTTHQSIRNIFILSRPRFWLYTAGPIILACAGIWRISPESLLDWRVGWFLCIGLLPANIFIYGINDYYDRETDLLSSKKAGKELTDMHAREHALSRSLPLLAMCGVLTLYATISNVHATIIWFLFVLLSWGYSAPPLRFKSKPFLDSASNILYILPACALWTLITQSTPSWWIIASAWAWCAAMHMYSAVPDIEADRNAGICTTAVYLGKNITLVVCALLWSISIILPPWQSPPHLYVLIGIVYPIMALTSMRLTSPQTISLYWLFPLINTVVGFILFFALMLK